MTDFLAPVLPRTADSASSPTAGLDAWRSMTAAQQPSWQDPGVYSASVKELSSLPPLVFAGEVDVLREQLALLTDASHPGHSLFYEYHSNESADPSRVLFHALGAWRITPGFHDILWNLPHPVEPAAVPVQTISVTPLTEHPSALSANP